MRRVRLVERLLVVAGAAALAMTFGAVALAHGATVQVTPSEAAAGTPISISGEDFEPGDEVTIVLESAMTETKLGTVTPGQDGSFTFQATVPASASGGSYSVRATNSAGGGDDEASGDFTVTVGASGGAGQAQPAGASLVYQRSTTDDLLIGFIFGVLGLIGLGLVLTARRHGSPMGFPS